MSCSVKPSQTKAKSKVQDHIPVKKYEPPSNVNITEAHEFVRYHMIDSDNNTATKVGVLCSDALSNLYVSTTSIIGIFIRI